MKFKLQTIFFLILLSCLTVQTYAESAAEEPYSESVYLHIGRDSYIAGEVIWYSAYCIPEGDTSFISKPLYVELVNASGKHVLGQIVEIEDGKASSSIYIPDTTSTGLYFIKAYTNWMCNFLPEYFFSKPVSIYNQYNEENNGNTTGYSVMMESLQDQVTDENSPEGMISFKSLADAYSTNQNAEFSLQLNDRYSGNVSVSIHKKEVCLVCDDDTTPLLEDKKEIRNSDDGMLYVAEDMGIVYSGAVLDPVNKEPVEGVEVILSLIDTIPTIYSSVTDRSGRFSYLFKFQKERLAYITLYSDGKLLPGNYVVKIDPKFRAAEAMEEQYQGIIETEDRNIIKDEAQRVMIQKAFGNQNLDMYDSLINQSDIYRAFYGDPMQVIYPDDYYMLPNFEEITRELFNRIKYKKTKKGCRISVYQLEENGFSYDPLVIVDGHPVKDLCDLYPLNSDDIEKIEMQSALSVSGNLLYNGLVAIYTTEAYIKKNGEFRNDRKKYWVPGYTVSPSFLDLYNSAQNAETGTIPNFRNQLLWQTNIDLNPGEEKYIRFETSNETGEYILDIQGFTSNGKPLKVRKIFSVEHR